MDLASGSMINDAVRLLEPLGQGGMGSVWVAEQLPSRAKVAVKLISSEASHNPEYRERFKREATIASQITNQHSVQMFDCGLTREGTPYIVMELLEGTDLTHAVAIKGVMSLPVVSQLVGQVAQVLELAHGMGVVHRDIKPDNIFLIESSDYEVFAKVLDFGVAKLRAAAEGGPAPGVTKTGAVMGSPEFMSPEQAISSKNIDHRSDLYSLGVSAYYALTGELPFVQGDQPLWVKLTSGDHIPPSAYVPSLSPEVDAWFARALAPRPEGRFQSARELAEAMEAIVCRPSWDGLGHYGTFASGDRPSWTGPQPLQSYQQSGYEHGYGQAGYGHALEQSYDHDDYDYEDSVEDEDTAIMSYSDHQALLEPDTPSPPAQLPTALPAPAAPEPMAQRIMPGDLSGQPADLPARSVQPWQQQVGPRSMVFKRRRTVLLVSCLVTVAVVAVVLLLRLG